MEEKKSDKVNYDEEKLDQVNFEEFKNSNKEHDYKYIAPPKLNMTCEEARDWAKGYKKWEGFSQRVYYWGLNKKKEIFLHRQYPKI